MSEESHGLDGGVMTQERPAPPKYQIELNHETSTVPHDMVDRVMGDLRKNRIRSILHTRRSLRENKGRELESFSLVDIPLRRLSDKTESPVFEHTIGSIMVRGSLAESRMGKFYTPDRIYRRDDGDIELRGADYFVRYDVNKPTPSEKLEIIERDFRDGLSVLEQVNKPTSEKEFLMYLGVLDYLKVHSLSILHAITYDERNGTLPQDQNAKSEYLGIRSEAINLMRSCVRKFYQAAAGLPFDAEDSFGDMDLKMQNLVSHLRKNTKEDENYKFTYPDINNPLVILLGAHEAGVQNPGIQTIVGLASGGTESAVATQLFYEYTHNFSPDLVILPISFHSKKISKADMVQQTDTVKQVYSDKFAGKSVLIVDDNSSSGQTLQTADNIVTSLGAINTEAHIAQHDPDRVRDGTKRSKKHQQKVFNMVHPKYGTTFGVVPTSPRFNEGVEMIKDRLRSHYSKSSRLVNQSY